jgi:hypothetical protein
MHHIPKIVRAAAIEVFGPPRDDKLLIALTTACSGHHPPRMALFHDPTRLPVAIAATHPLEDDRLALERLRYGQVVSMITLSIV